MTTPLYIFDLDGTLALIEHRRSILDQKDKGRWRRFFAACDQDEPNYAVIQTMELLRQAGAEIRIFSGRSADVREKTIVWLLAHTQFTREQLKTALLMRNSGDFTADNVLKQHWFEHLSAEDKNRLVAIFDDRDKVVNMWREQGLSCFQVAPGDF